MSPSNMTEIKVDSVQAKGSGTFTITAAVQLPVTLYSILSTHDVFFSHTEDDGILLFCFLYA